MFSNSSSNIYLSKEREIINYDELIVAATTFRSNFFREVAHRFHIYSIYSVCEIRTKIFAKVFVRRKPKFSNLKLIDYFF